MGTDPGSLVPRHAQQTEPRLLRRRHAEWAFANHTQKSEKKAWIGRRKKYLGGQAESSFVCSPRLPRPAARRKRREACAHAWSVCPRERHLPSRPCSGSVGTQLSWRADPPAGERGKRTSTCVCACVPALACAVGGAGHVPHPSRALGVTCSWRAAPLPLIPTLGALCDAHRLASPRAVGMMAVDRTALLSSVRDT